MKYLLSILLFLGFIFFSIPCFADVTNNDASFNFQNQTVNVVNRALLPKEVIQDASNQASLTPKTEIGVTGDFLKNITCTILRAIGLKEAFGYCPFDLSVGENTSQYAVGSKILGQASIPTNMELIPATKSADLGDFTATNSASTTGNEKINQLSENLGTTTGFFRSNEAPLSDYDACIKRRLEENEGKNNFILNGKPFKEDQRSADIFCSKQVFCMGHYPKVDGKAICPFEPPTQ